MAAPLHDRNIASTDALMTAVHDWLTGISFTNPWTDNGIDTGTNVAGLSIGNLFVQFSWTGAQIDMSQSTATSATAVFDSETGNVGFNSEVVFPATVTSAELWGFANDSATATDRYAHFVVEFNKDGRYIHFGFGQIAAADKFWSWTGGAYKYGGEWTEATVGWQPWNTSHRFLLDGLHTSTGSTANIATMRLTGVAGQDATSLWSIFTLATPSTVEAIDDDAGNPLSALFGGSRFGPWLSLASFQRQSTNNAAIHLMPIVVAYRDDTLTYMPLGRMSDTRIANIGNIQPKDQITFDGDTWQFFPWAQKLTLTSDGSVPASRNAGVAYKVFT